MIITSGDELLHSRCGYRGTYLVAPRFNFLNIRDDWIWFYPAPCWHNIFSALYGRVGKHVPAYDKSKMSPLEEVATILASECRAETQSYSSVYRHYGSSKRARYERAHRHLMQRDHLVTHRDSRISMFVKMEAYRLQSHKPFPDCRAIQFRSFEYTLKLASMIKGPEHRLYGLRDVPGLCPGQIFAKNLNQWEKATALREHFDRGYENMICLDATRFDAHCNPGVLKIEHKFWTTANKDPELKKLLNMQLRNSGSVVRKTGVVKYVVKGGRMSGDANTAGGNCIIMACLLCSFFRKLERRFCVIIDGDDSVCFYDGPRITQEEIDDYFRPLGFVMGVECRPTIFEEIDFCQSKPVLVDNVWTMIRNPFKIISKLGYTHKPDNYPSYVKRLLTTATCEAWLARGVPILQEYCHRIIESCDKALTRRQRRRGKYLSSESLSYRMQHLITKVSDVEAIPVSNQTRESFKLAFGLSATRQREIETRLKDWKFSLNHTAGGGVNDHWFLEFPYPEWRS